MALLNLTKSGELQVKIDATMALAGVLRSNKALQLAAHNADFVHHHLHALLKHLNLAAGGGKGDQASQLLVATLRALATVCHMWRHPSGENNVGRTANHAAAGSSSKQTVEKKLEDWMGQIKAGLGDMNVDVRVAALECVLGLSRSVANLRTKLKDGEFVPTVCELLLDKDPRMQRLTTAIIGNMFLEDTLKTEIMAANNVLPELAKRLDHCYPRDVRNNAAAAVKNLLFSYHRQQDQDAPDGFSSSAKVQIMSHLPWPMLMALLADHSVQEQALGILRNFMFGPAADAALVCRAFGGVTELLDVLQEPFARGDVACTEQALFVLCNLTAAKDTERSNAVVGHGGIMQGLGACLDAGDTFVKVPAMLCVRNLSSASESEDAACSSERQARLLSLFEHRLRELVHDANPDVKGRAGDILRILEGCVT